MDSAEAELLATLQREPEDDEARLVYADWLEERADPRGEYLRLEVESRRIPPRLAELQRRLPADWLTAVGRRFCVVLSGNTTNKIMAIKTIREITGLGLKDSKDLLDAACSNKRKVLVRDREYAEAEDLARRFDRNLAHVEREPFDESRSLAIAPSGPRTSPARYRVVLTRVESDRALDVIKRVRELTQRGLTDAKDLVDTVLAGTPATLHASGDARTAADMAIAFVGLGEVRLEPAG